MSNRIEGHRVVSRAEWIEASTRHVALEKELTRLRDRLSEERRDLPWVKLDQAYAFQTREGTRTLAELFGGNSQLVVYHFMFAPGDEAGCIGCSFVLDHMQGALVHLAHHDVSVVVVSRAPLVEIERYRARMGWNVKWASSSGSDFNYDFKVSFTPKQVASGLVDYNFKMQAPWGPEASGVSVFFKDERGDVFHTYSSFGRGGEGLLGAYTLLDMVPKGRSEPATGAKMQHWVKRHDEYDGGAATVPHACCN
ncbi:thioredoxin family protein [Variovorax sp. J22R133]|uniref:DUF899 domain-containing protein n=1 Tax=Variovorax brevis TaxID=3053503 RepID=UPI0025772258|nr:thioredoxin family protein [Variovorax sp. J22R133]MDM0112871.1 thioredoxin family protein [Variovorax sp. J22R133]